VLLPLAPLPPKFEVHEVELVEVQFTAKGVLIKMLLGAVTDAVGAGAVIVVVADFVAVPPAPVHVTE
jgi:hypothetical protein